MSDVGNKQKELLLKLLQEAIAQDESLRQNYQVGDKFRFIRDKLKGVFEQAEKQLATLDVNENSQADLLAEDETIVYVYLFNAQGVLLSTWQKMLKPTLFYEYSVNRPIYADKAGIDAYLRNKTNKQQHAYLAVAIKKAAIVETEVVAKDNLGNPLIKVKEGSLHFSRLINFTHNDLSYQVSEAGELKAISDVT